MVHVKRSVTVVDSPNENKTMCLATFFNRNRLAFCLSGFLVGCGVEGTAKPTNYVECLEKAIYETKHPVAFEAALDHCEKLFPEGAKEYQGWESLQGKKS
jgi:hypothetical protein